jgi:uroporphyrinogen-III synthase
MSRPRVLVVRSGANPFVSVGPSAEVDVVEVVSHTIVPLVPPAAAFGGGIDLVVFTSQAAVERLHGDAVLAARFREAAPGARVAAVGPATADALRELAWPADLVAEGSAEALLDRLPARLDGKRVLLPCGEDAAAELPDGLHRRGATVFRVPIYRKTPRPRDAVLDRGILERPFAAFCVTSPSAGLWLFEGLAADAAARLRATPAVVLGRFTRRTLEGRGVERIVITPEPLFSSALRTLERLAAAAGAA